MSIQHWIAKYSQGIPAKITEAGFENLLELFNNAFKHFGGSGRKAFENMGGAYLSRDQFAVCISSKRCKGLKRE